MDINDELASRQPQIEETLGMKSTSQSGGECCECGARAIKFFFGSDKRGGATVQSCDCYAECAWDYERYDD